MADFQDAYSARPSRTLSNWCLVGYVIAVIAVAVLWVGVHGMPFIALR